MHALDRTASTMPIYALSYSQGTLYTFQLCMIVDIMNRIGRRYRTRKKLKKNEDGENNNN